MSEGRKVLLTGGLGFIGSHTAVVLIERGYDLVIADNLSNTTEEPLDGIEAITGVRPTFEKVDLSRSDETEAFFTKHPKFDGVINFAAFKAVGESYKDPLKYYSNNIQSLSLLLQQCAKRKIPKFIFSSSCTVYGEAEHLPIDENAPIQEALSPYGNTKQIGEEIIRDTIEVHPELNCISLRYFNPIGAHPTAAIGELPLGPPLNLVPFVTQTAAGIREQLQVFGDDYDTPDGTNIRDYIHVMDVAQAQVCALERLLKEENETAMEFFNLGTGKGSSVLEVIRSFEKVSGQSLNYRIVERRRGDVTAAYADTTKANEVLGWSAQYGLDDAIRDAWRWEKKIRNIE
jgi:UDP-glucose 4-epimerase